MKDFIWKFIIWCFGLLRVLITDNDYQFSNFKIAKFYRDLDISHYFTSIDHTQTNGKVEVANITIL